MPSSGQKEGTFFLRAHSERRVGPPRGCTKWLESGSCRVQDRRQDRLGCATPALGSRVWVPAATSRGGTGCTFAKNQEESDWCSEVVGMCPRILWASLCSHTSPEPKYHREWSRKDRPPLRLTFWCLAGIGSCTRLWGCRGWGAPNKPRRLPGVPKPCPEALRRTCTPAGPYQARQAAATLAHPCLQVHTWPTSAHRGAPSPIPAPPPALLRAPGA